MLLFLDTEFTGLGQPDPKLISIALVPADGRPPFYAELREGEGWTRNDCTEFVLLNVLPLLKGGDCSVTRAELHVRLLSWFEGLPRSIRAACDSQIDFRFLKQVLSDCWPEKLDQRQFDLRPLVDTTVYDSAVQRFYIINKKEAHNALNDALAYRQGWMAWQS